MRVLIVEVVKTPQFINKRVLNFIVFQELVSCFGFLATETLKITSSRLAIVTFHRPSWESCSLNGELP